MTMVVGVFENRVTAAQTINAPLKAGFQEKQLGFVARKDTMEDLYDYLV